MDEKMQEVLALMQARASGKATNEEVEAAVSNLLNKPNKETPSSQSRMEDDSKTKDIPVDNTPVAMEGGTNESSQIDIDQGEYDDFDEPPPAPETTIERDANKKRPKTPPDPPKRKRGRPRKTPLPPPDTHHIDFSIYEDIPLGRQGARMMTNFGDFRQPDSNAVEATLLGTRRMVQAAIQDARYVRRGNKEIFTAAAASMRSYRPKKPSKDTSVSSELLFRASMGYDRLGYDLKCGFDVEELQTLYPEEMAAFTRWSLMHKESSKGTKGLEDKESAAKIAVEEGEEVDTQDAKTENGIDVPIPEGGHLEERAAQFDTRTDRMVEDWYVKFSDVRTGSFLPKRHRNKEDAAWNAVRDKKLGAHRGGNWGHFSAVYVRFLHWLGFDPQSALPPPSLETTEALGFLAHDFFGRIVEKAVFLRNLKKHNGDQTKVVIELADGEKLQVVDIERAMKDPAIAPVPLYSRRSSEKVPQLYFGPGFEERMEMELEQAELAETMISEEELKILQEEDNLFSKLAEPPDKNAFGSLIDDKKEAFAAKKKRAEEKLTDLITEDNAVECEPEIVKQTESV